MPHLKFENPASGGERLSVELLVDGDDAGIDVYREVPARVVLQGVDYPPGVASVAVAGLDCHDGRADGVVLVDDPRQRAHEHRWAVLDVGHGEGQLGEYRVDTVVDSDRELEDLAPPASCDEQVYGSQTLGWNFRKEKK